MTLSDLEQEIAITRVFCPLCRGEGYILTGATVRRCPECDRRDWEDFHAGRQDLPPCYGYASCAPGVMKKCPWRKDCREVHG